MMQSENPLDRHAARVPWWVRHPRQLARIGVTAVIVSAAIFWVILTRRPEAPPAQLEQLDRIVGTVDQVSADVRPLYTTRRGRKASVHQAEQRGWRIALNTAAGQHVELLLRSDDEGIPGALGPGTGVTAYARDGEIFQLESARGVLVDLGQVRSERAVEASAALLLLGLAFVGGLALCGMAAVGWKREARRT
jgi:hypothetical protein